MNRLLLGGLAALFTSAADAPLAHHSFAMFDQNTETVLRGVVTEFQWTNPHAWIELDVPGAGGAVRHWSVETGSMGVLARQGWKSTSLKPGDRVSVLVNPLRSGEPGGSLRGLIFPDGRTHGKPFTVPVGR